MRAGFVLCVNLHFASDEAKDAFLVHFKILSDAVMESEPLTLSFQLMQSDRSPLSLLLFERFADKKAYISIHKGSLQFKRLKSYLLELGPLCTIDGHSYIELESYGFIIDRTDR